MQRRPALLTPIALALIVALAIPVLSLRLGNSDQGNDPAGTTTRKAYDLLASGVGPGFNGHCSSASSSVWASCCCSWRSAASSCR